MASATTNPTRMELRRLKSRRKTALRGHKLLKNKRDELMRQFLELMQRNKELRSRTEEGLINVHRAYIIASSIMSPEMTEQALCYPSQEISVDMKTRNIMSVNVPTYSFRRNDHMPEERLPYGLAQTSGELDDAVDALSEVFRDMLELAQIEKTTLLLAQEIEKTRRRVNALEYVMIPALEQSIRYISMKLEENQRSNTSRLMKVKDMMLLEEREKAEQKPFETKTQK